MKNSGLKNETQVSKILVSGSTALAERNSAGVRLFRESDLGDGIISGKLIRPKYNTDELKKSIDTDIFELIPQEAPVLPDMVLRSVYNVATQSINDLTLQVQQLTEEVGFLNSKVSELEIVSESLKIEADNEQLKANISEQQAITANEQVATTTIDLQNAIQNSINEAVERVSLTARIEALQESFRVQKELTIQREKENAAQTAVDGLNGFFQQTANVGWKISANDVQNQSVVGLYIETENDNKVTYVNGSKGVAFFNFTDTEQTFTVSYTGNKVGNENWFEGPTSFKVPPRTENAAGVTTAKFRFRARPKVSGNKRNTTFTATVTINTTSGDNLTFKAYYKKEVKRKDTWGVVGSANVIVGEDVTGG
jgi:hypothetical protein